MFYSHDKPPSISNKKERGAALLMALFFFTVVTFVVTQLSNETLTESVLASRNLKKIRARYSAQAGLEIALLRIKAYQFARSQISQLPAQQAASIEQQLNMIWQFPLPWPLPIPEEAGTIAQDDGEKVLKKSLISRLEFNHSIQDSGQKIDLNSLGSPIKSISERTLASLTRSFEQILINDKVLAKEHSIDSIKLVLNNVADWIDEDDESRNGGGEKSNYPLEEQRGYPRNASFLSFSELMLVDQMDDLIFNHLKSLVTAYGTFGINVNTAEKDVLQALDPQFTDEVTARFLERRSEIQSNGANLTETSFEGLLDELGFSNISEISTKGIPILYSPLSSFEVISTGYVGNVQTEITAYVLDAAAIKEIFIEQIAESSKQDGNSNDPNNPQTGNTGQQPANPNNTPNANSNGNNPDSERPKTPPPPAGKPYIIHLDVS